MKFVIIFLFILNSVLSTDIQEILSARGMNMKNMNKKEKDEFLSDLKKSMLGDNTVSADSNDPNSLKININLQHPDDKKKDAEEEEQKNMRFQQKANLENTMTFVQTLLKQVVSLKQERLKDMEDQFKDQNMENLKLNSDNQQYSDDKSEVQSKINDEKNQCREAKQKVERTQKELQKKKEEITSNQLSINNQLSEIMKMTERIEIPVYEYEKSNKELLQARKEKLNLVNFKTSSLEQFKNLESNRKELILNQDKLKQRINVLSETYEKLQILLEQELNKRKQIERNIKNMTNDDNLVQQQLVLIKKDNEKLTQEVADKKIQLTKSEDEYQQISDELQQAKKEMQMKRQTLKEKESQLNVLKTQHESKLEELNDEFKKIKNKAKIAFDGQKGILKSESQKIKVLSDMQDKMLEHQKKQLDLLLLQKMISSNKEETNDEQQNDEGMEIEQAIPSMIAETGFNDQEKMEQNLGQLQSLVAKLQEKHETIKPEEELN